MRPPSKNQFVTRQEAIGNKQRAGLKLLDFFCGRSLGAVVEGIRKSLGKHIYIVCCSILHENKRNRNNGGEKVYKRDDAIPLTGPCFFLDAPGPLSLTPFFISLSLVWNFVHPSLVSPQ